MIRCLTVLLLLVSVDANAADLRFGSGSYARLAHCRELPVCNSTRSGAQSSQQYFGGPSMTLDQVVEFNSLHSVEFKTEFGTLDLPGVGAAVRNDGVGLRVSTTVVAFREFIYHGAEPIPFSLTGELHIIDKSTDTLNGTVAPFGSAASSGIRIFDANMVPALSTPFEITEALFTTYCGIPGLLASVSSSTTTGGPQTLTATTTGCSGGQFVIQPGANLIILSGVFFSAVPGGYIDAMETFSTRLGDDLSTAQKSTLTTFLTSSSVAPSEVPEPSTWISMILGFGLVGLSLRQKSEMFGSPSNTAAFSFG